MLLNAPPKRRLAPDLPVLDVSPYFSSLASRAACAWLRSKSRLCPSTVRMMEARNRLFGLGAEGSGLRDSAMDRPGVA